MSVATDCPACDTTIDALTAFHNGECPACGTPTRQLFREAGGEY